MTELTEDAAGRGKGRRIEVADETLTYPTIERPAVTPASNKLKSSTKRRLKTGSIRLASARAHDVQSSSSLGAS